MALTDIVANYILNLLNEANGCAEIQRNELAGSLGCVPSQINYVISSRFTPEQGYIVESRRGGGGFIRITRVCMDRNSALMHIVNSIGSSLDCSTARIMLSNLVENSLLHEEVAKLIAAAISIQSYIGIPQEYHNILRAATFKNMLMTQI